MTFLSYLVVIFGYIAPLYFILGIAYRVWNWKHRPIGFNWELFPKPTKSKWASVFFGRLFALPTLFQSNRKILLLAIIMHGAIITSVFLHLELFVPLGAEKVIDILGSIAGFSGVILVGYFIFRRIAVRETRDISAASDYFWLSLLLLQVFIGAYIRVNNLVDPEVYRTFARSIITLSPTLPPMNPWFLAHALLGEFYLMYIVSGKMIHSIGWLFAQYILVSERQ